MRYPSAKEEEHFSENGVMVLPNAISGSDLKCLQTAFDRCATAAKPTWLEDLAAGTQPAAYFDIPNPLAQDDIFINLVTHPAFFGFLSTFFNSDFRLIFTQFRTVPSSPFSYVGWHYDVDRNTTPLHLKVQLYLHDVGPEDGPFAYIPGSHKNNAGPYPPVRHLKNMPGHTIYPGSAGTVLLFNSYGMHSAMINRTGQARKSIILIYEKSNPSNYDPERFSWLADKLSTDTQRRLFGLANYSI